MEKSKNIIVFIELIFGFIRHHFFNPAIFKFHQNDIIKFWNKIFLSHFSFRLIFLTKTCRKKQSSKINESFVGMIWFSILDAISFKCQIDISWYFFIIFSTFTRLHLNFELFYSHSLIPKVNTYYGSLSKKDKRYVCIWSFLK